MPLPPRTKVLGLLSGLLLFLVAAAGVSLVVRARAAEELARVTERDVPLLALATEVTAAHLEQAIRLERGLPALARQRSRGAQRLPRGPGRVRRLRRRDLAPPPGGPRADSRLPRRGGCRGDPGARCHRRDRRRPQPLRGARAAGALAPRPRRPRRGPRDGTARSQGRGATRTRPRPRALGGSGVGERGSDEGAARGADGARHRLGPARARPRHGGRRLRSGGAPGLRDAHAVGAPAGLRPTARKSATIAATGTSSRPTWRNTPTRSSPTASASTARTR